MSKAQQELMEQLPCYVSTDYQPALDLIAAGKAAWVYPNVRFGCGKLQSTEDSEIPRTWNEVHGWDERG